MSRRASASEGEIVESDREKATKSARPSGDRMSVNARLRDALSPSPERAPYSPYRSDSSQELDRPRSPYRASTSPRGEKRRRGDDHPSPADQRRFKVPHEGPTRGDKNSRKRHENLNRRGSSNASSNYGDRDRRDRRDRAQQGLPSRRGRSLTEQRRLGSYRDDGQKRSRQGAINGSLDAARLGAHDSASSRSSGHSASAESTTYEHQFPTSNDRPSTGETVKLHTPASKNSEPRYADESIDPAQVDDTTSIEERRKRREAIKAKYKDQGNSLLVQALQHESAPGTPISKSERSGEASLSCSDSTANSDNIVSPETSSPPTPQPQSGPGSPPSLTVLDDADLANTRAAEANADEPSAADYDPSMDRREDRLRDGSPALRDEHTTDEREPTQTGSTVDEPREPPTKKLKVSDDMFASDDEDDMFAPAVPKDAGVDQSESSTAPAKKAKALDQSLLDNWDDHEGYYRIILGELIDGRYNIQAILGKGIFSSVVRAIDSETNKLVAIKIIRNNERMIKAGTQEMEILQKLGNADPDDKKHLIRLERSFMHKGHLCMVFENLSINLREVLKKFGRDVGINLKAVRSYAQQMFLGLSLLRKCNILHADLKPDNILVNEARNTLKICDLGSAADAADGEITEYVVSRFYRAPEIILGMQYGFAIDMWSIGCTLFELYTGKILFTGRTNNQMLRGMMECRGKFSPKMLKKANPEYVFKHFEDVNIFRSLEVDKITGKEVTKLINFANKPVRDLKSRLVAAAGGGSGKGPIAEAELREVNLFADLLDRCLSLNPERRITPAEALRHPFIHRSGSSGLLMK